MRDFLYNLVFIAAMAFLALSLLLVIGEDRRPRHEIVDGVAFAVSDRPLFNADNLRELETNGYTYVSYGNTHILFNDGEYLKGWK